MENVNVNANADVVFEAQRRKVAAWIEWFMAEVSKVDMDVAENERMFAETHGDEAAEMCIDIQTLMRNPLYWPTASQRGRRELFLCLEWVRGIVSHRDRVLAMRAKMHVNKKHAAEGDPREEG